MTQTVATGVHVSEAEGFLFAANSYAIRELARRAGVSRSTFETWRIESDGCGYLSVYLKPGTNRRVRFPQIVPDFVKKIVPSRCSTATATWMGLGDSPCSSIADFKVPFSGVEQESVGPLFVLESSQSIRCSVDLLTSLLLVLSRFEETLGVPRDEHGRFSAFSSVAWRDGFLHRPIVDEWGLAFAEGIQYLLPGWQPEGKTFCVKLGHDVDELGRPFRLRSAIAHTARRHALGATLRDLVTFVDGRDTTYQVLLREVVELARSRGLDSAVYWKCSESGPNDTGYDPRHPGIRNMISTFREMGVELGIHPSYQSYDSPTKFRKEIVALKKLLEVDSVGGRQDFLRWRPETWIEWEEQGIAYDASVGFADYIGFRAGTCHPYRPWLLARGREANLLEIPLIAMDSTLLSYMKLEEEEALAKLRDCVARCRGVGGVFTLVWHNTRIMNPRHRWLYLKLLDDLTGSAHYDWRSANREIY
jgi:hypothetical protein